MFRKEGNIVLVSNAYIPVRDYIGEYEEILRPIAIKNLDVDRLVLRTKQTMFL